MLLIEKLRLSLSLCSQLESKLSLFKKIYLLIERERFLLDLYHGLVKTNSLFVKSKIKIKVTKNV